MPRGRQRQRGAARHQRCVNTPCLRRFGVSRVHRPASSAKLIPYQFTLTRGHTHTDSRALLNASFRSLLRTYILAPRDERPPEALVALLTSPRVRMVDLSYLDDATGTTLIHEAARRRDLRMVELAVRAGADVFMRDRRGRTPCDGYPKDDKVRVFLRQCTSASILHSNAVLSCSFRCSREP